MKIQELNDGEWVCECGLFNDLKSKSCIDCKKSKTHKTMKETNCPSCDVTKFKFKKNSINWVCPKCKVVVYNFDNPNFNKEMNNILFNKLLNFVDKKRLKEFKIVLSEYVDNELQLEALSNE